jgi:hypothetical protein
MSLTLLAIINRANDDIYLKLTGITKTAFNKIVSQCNFGRSKNIENYNEDESKQLRVFAILILYHHTQPSDDEEPNVFRVSHQFIMHELLGYSEINTARDCKALLNFALKNDAIKKLYNDKFDSTGVATLMPPKISEINSLSELIVAYPKLKNLEKVSKIASKKKTVKPTHEPEPELKKEKLKEEGYLEFKYPSELLQENFLETSYSQRLAEKSFTLEKYDLEYYIDDRENHHKKYIDKPVEEKKKQGEDNFRELAAWFLIDMEFAQIPVNIQLYWYAACVLNFNMHNSTHYPAQGYGKAQEREIDLLLKYYRTQFRHPHSKLFNDIIPGNGKGYLIRNSVFQKILIDRITLKDDSFKEGLKNLSLNGKSEDPLVKQFGPLLGYTGARANNLRAYYYCLREASQDSEEEASDKLQELLTQLTQKRLPAKLRKLDMEDLTERINGLFKQFKILQKKELSEDYKANLAKEIAKQRYSYADYIYKSCQKLAKLQKLTKLKVHMPCSDSSTLIIQLYPEIKTLAEQDDLINSENYTHGVKNALIGFLGGLINYNAKRKGLHIHTQRRQSFGFLRPTLTDIDDLNIRLSLGVDASDYKNVVVESLKQLNNILIKYNFVVDAENQHILVKKCLEIYEAPRGKTVKEKTGRTILTAMRSSNDEWVAVAMSEKYLDLSDGNSTKAFENYLNNFITERIQRREKQENPKGKERAGKRKDEENFSSRGFISLNHSSVALEDREQDLDDKDKTIFSILQNLLKFAVEFILAHQPNDVSESSLFLSRSYWHILWKLYKNIDKGIYLLQYQDKYEFSHLTAKANLLIENILEYLISADALQRMYNKPKFHLAEVLPNKKNIYAETIYVYVKNDLLNFYYIDKKGSIHEGILKDFVKVETRKSLRSIIKNGEEIEAQLADELTDAIESNIAYKHHQNLLAERAAKLLEIDQSRVEVFFHDGGQQAIISSILAMDLQFHEKGSYLSDGNIYIYNKSYYELNLFFDKVAGTVVDNKEKAKVAFIDVTQLHELDLEELPHVESVIIDITHNPTMQSDKLKETIEQLQEKNIWIVLSGSCLKHEELGLDKFQAGRNIIIAPEGMSLKDKKDGAFNELEGISREAFNPIIADFLSNIKTVLESESSEISDTVAAKSKQSTYTQSELLTKRGLFPKAETKAPTKTSRHTYKQNIGLQA